MPHSSLIIPPAADFWPQAAAGILSAYPDGLTGLRVVVPAFSHAQQLKMALSQQLGRTFIAPQINTPAGWLAMQAPPVSGAVASDSQRLMVLYAELRQHAWLKKLFTARRNTDLLPLAQTLLSLSDELTLALLPALQSSADLVAQQWQDALEKLTPPARKLLSDESQLVWSVWKSQLDASDTGAARFAQMMRIAEQASVPLVWINPVAPDAMERAFLQAYSQSQNVLSITLDWRATSIPAVYCKAWKELPDTPSEDDIPIIATPVGIVLCDASGLEDEAQQGAQTIVNWLLAGKSQIALVAQDRVVARRIRALLERAEIFVADETGWKLSTTRAAAALAAWFDVVTSRAETAALLDFLKSPYVLENQADKADQVMLIEATLRRANVLGGWESVGTALAEFANASRIVAQLQQQAQQFSGRKTLPEWIALTHRLLDVLDLSTTLKGDSAGMQVMDLMTALAQDCAAMTQEYSFPEWRAFLSLQFESAPFIADASDRRVVMLPLNGARLRRFDAVLMVGCDAANLPSHPKESLFFANAVRRELGLATRESRQRQQLRDFTELLCTNSDIVLSWQGHKNGEPNAASAWIERLQLTLQRDVVPILPQVRVDISSKELSYVVIEKPAPSAPQLTPAKLSASGYNSFIACPYQFFATRMLHLSALDELSDMPEKRDYGGWLHQILNTYHVSLKTDPAQEREVLLRAISEQVFALELKKNAAALGYDARWKKVIPAYLEWANAREAQGWAFAFGEEWFERTLAWDEGEVVLHGRIDRVDQNSAGDWAVLDYKTNALQVLKNKLKGGEDQQLPFYGLLLDRPVEAAHFVAVELSKHQTGDAEAANFSSWQSSLQKNIVSHMQAIHQGAPLTANGIESICQYCDVRGLCRKGAW